MPPLFGYGNSASIYDNQTEVYKHSLPHDLLTPLPLRIRYPRNDPLSSIMAQEQPIVRRLQLVDHLQLHSHRLLGGLEFDTDPVLLRPQVSDRGRCLLDLRAAYRPVRMSASA